MDETSLIPMFPLRLLPLPDELIPLHIFEPRYKQLFHEVENRDIRFGIYFDHPLNADKIGSIMRLESVIKRYPKGELDVVVKCEDIFYLQTLDKHYPGKQYPGGEVSRWNITINTYPDETLAELFSTFKVKRGIGTKAGTSTIFEIANELNFDFTDRYKFITHEDKRQQKFLHHKLQYMLQLLDHEEKSRDVFHLN
jgi:uncharacterized protein